MKRIALTLLILTISACAPRASSVTAPEAQPLPTVRADPGTASPTAGESNVDILADLPAPVCDSGLTPEQTEGPYYLAGSPEQTSLLGGSVEGERLILAGYVVNQDCFPIPNAWLDFWQADSNGEYDLTGFSLRGHQFTDNKGRFYLETVLPGIYESRPIRHIHVKVQAPGGVILTTQLYFPEQPIQGLTVTLQQHEGFLLAIFNFVISTTLP